MAEKIILELKDKDFILNANIISSVQEENIITLPRDVANDIKNTLVNMGYNPKDVEKVLSKLPEDMEDIGSILPYCIRELS
jgi:Holliday junction resolvasome RuvABC DNA-binding subunit